MRKQLLKIFTFALVLGLFSSTSFGQIGTPPTIDGDGSDAAWANITAFELLREHNVTTKDDAADFSATVKAMWDADNLYVLIEMMDDTLDTESLNPWERDHYSVYLDFGNHKSTGYIKDSDMTKDSVQFMLEKIWSVEANLAFSNQAGNLDSALVWGVHFAEKIDTGSMYTLEVAIPMVILGMDPLQADDVIGFDAKVGDNDGGTLDRLSLYQVNDEGWQNPSYIGTAKLEADGSISRVKHAPMIDGMADYAWYAAPTVYKMEVPHNVTTKENDNDFSGTFRVMHDLENVYVMVQMKDDTLDTESLNPWERDHYSVYLDFGNLKTSGYVKDADMIKDSVQFMLEKIWSVEANLAFTNQAGNLDSALVWGVHFAEKIDTGSMYTLEVAIPLDMLGMDPLQEGAVIGFDAKVGDNDGGTLDRLSWHQSQDEGWQNPSFLGNMMVEPVFFDLGPLTAAPAQIEVDGVKDGDWNHAIAMPLLREKDVTTKENDADFSGTVKALWDADNFYVLLEMKDDTLDTESLNPWERDHYSLYFDFGNLKTTSYVRDKDETKDSVQFMLEKIWSVEANLAFTNQAGNLDSALVWGVHFVEVIDTGSMYTLEVGIPLDILGVTLSAGQTIGFDAKIGDNDGGTLDRLSWSQLDDQGWQNPSFLGEVTLMGNGTIMGTPATNTIVDIVVASPDHTIAETAVIAAELADDLSAPGPFTVFAPTDAAFAALPEGVLDGLLLDPTGDLASLLLHHVVSGKVMSTDLTDGMTVATLLGIDIYVTINEQGVFINESKVTGPDILADNGVIHVIDAVLNPLYSPGTGVREQLMDDVVSIYPNPATDQLNIESGSEIKYVRVTSLIGKSLLNIPVNASNTLIDISNIDAGMYIVTVHFESGVTNKVLIIQ